MVESKKSQKSTSVQRIDSLDYLRGIMAFSVMLYHYQMWSGLHLEKSFSFVGVLGVYAVSTFYILSGLSLMLVYQYKLNNKKDIIDYFVRRIFRIFPLMWLAISLSLFFIWFSEKSIVPDLTTIFLNYSLLFSYFDYDGYIATGSWSIGNEMVFYLFFPVIILLMQRSRYTLYVWLVFACSLAIYFSFYKINTDLQWTEQWKYYINPFNQIYFFISGMLIAYASKPNTLVQKKLIYTLILLIFLFIAIPELLSSSDFITNWNRVYYSILFFLLTYLFFVCVNKIDNLFGDFLKFLGEVSYSIYLLHPLVSMPVVSLSTKLGVDMVEAYFFLAVPITLVSAYISYRFIEQPMIRVGKNIVKSIR